MMGADMKKTSTLLKDDKGMAVLESVVIMFIFVILARYSIGFFGVTHTAILQSIASRTYAFEIFRHRSNLWYFRDNITYPPTLSENLHYHNFGNRIHGTNNEISLSGNRTQYPTERRVVMFIEEEPTGRSWSDHANAISDIQNGVRNTAISLDPVWIKTQYGICLTAECGD